MKLNVENFLIDKLTKKLSVMVIESDKFIYDNFDEYLNGIFRNVVYCSNENDVLTSFQSQKPDLVFIDLQVKDLQSFKLVKKIKDNFPTQIFIAVSDTKDPDLLIKIIKHRFQNFIQKSFDINILKDTIVECMECVIVSMPDKLSDQEIEKVKDITIDEALDTLLDNNENEIELINHYKGIPIMKDALLIDKIGDTIQVRINDIQSHALEYSRHVMISSKFLSNNILGFLKSIDTQKNIVYLDNLSFINSYAHHRKNVRVVPDKSLHLSYELMGTKYRCDVVDMSESYCLISFDKLPEKFKISESLLFYISFKVPYLKMRTTRSFCYSYKEKFMIEDIFKVGNKTKVLLHFSLEGEKAKSLHDYIYFRSLNLIREYKKGNFK